MRTNRETPEQIEARTKWLEGADATQGILLHTKLTPLGPVVYLGQPEKLDLRINRIAVAPVQLAQALMSVVEALTGQQAAQTRVAAGGADGEAQGGS